MDIVAAQYDQWGQIIVTVADQPPDLVITVPDDMNNKDRQELAAWEAKGNTITPHAKTAPPDRDNYNAMLERRMNVALDEGDTDTAFKILLQRVG